MIMELIFASLNHTKNQKTFVANLNQKNISFPNHSRLL